MLPVLQNREITRQFGKHLVLLLICTIRRL